MRGERAQESEGDVNDEKPYVEKTTVTLEYNPEYGDDRVCRCGHSYYRHFDTHDDMSNVGCKYCECAHFEERTRADPIRGFQGEFRWLSNFWPCVIYHDGVYYPSTENAYQALKFEHPSKRRLIATLDPGQAKRYARSNFTPSPEWLANRVRLMKFVLKKKFERGSELAAKLEETGDRHIEETNHWGDTFWGVCDGVGENHLGRLIMEIREENRST